MTRNNILLLITTITVLSLSVYWYTALPSHYLPRAEVTHITSDMVTNDSSPGFAPTHSEVVQARILTSGQKSSVITVNTSYTNGDGQRLKENDVFYVATTSHDTNATINATTTVYVSLDHYRVPVVLLYLALFFGLVIYFGRLQGVRGLIAMLCGLGLILYVLVPGLLHGYSPLLLSILIASFVATIGAYMTHGISRMTSAAVLGMILTICIATLMTEFAVHWGYLNGLTDETTTSLFNDSTYSLVDFQGLLLGGIIIGLLGVLYDAAIGQAVAVEELHRAAPHVSRSFIYARAIRMGREHIGALVNTLIMAYVGISLPLLLIFYPEGVNNGSMPFLNWGFVSTEIIRMTTGGIALILTIPITTIIAVRLLVPRENTATSEILAKEEETMEKMHHTH